MRFNTIPGVIPETRGVEPSARLFAEEATFCFKHLCAIKVDNRQTTTRCGPVFLTITHTRAPSSVEECVSQFSYLIAQDAESGISQTEKAVYDISVQNDSEPALNQKRAKPIKAKPTTAKPTTASKAASITGKPSSVKPTGSKTSSRVSSSATPSASACPLPRKGKNGKPIQRRCAGDQFYAKRDLLLKKVTHWKFNTMGDPKTYNADANAKVVLDKMNRNGQLDVVKVLSGDLTVVGNINDPEVILSTMRGTDPNAFAKKGGNYLLTNGGFFQHMETRPRSFEPAGEDTMVKTADGTVLPYEEAYPVPPEYKGFYNQIDGLEGTRVHSEPDLKQNIPEITTKTGIWKYDENDPILVGRLSHASQPNEHIALVRFSATYYIIEYTSKGRGDGVSTNDSKAIIDLFFSRMGETGKSISSSTQAVCLDGGPSISMTWNEGVTMEKLTLGGAGDVTPAPSTNGRKGSNLIKIAAK